MGSSPSSSSSSSCDEIGLKRGPWTLEEDEKLVSFITKHGHGSWRILPKLAGLNRCGKSCRLRWTNYLRPNIKRGKFSEEEQQIILNLHSILGNKWSVIASHLPGRTDNEIKNLWNTHLKKRLIQMGFDPITHMPKIYDNTLSSHLLPLPNLQKFLHFDLPPLEHRLEAQQMATLQEYLHHVLKLPISPFTPTFRPLQYDRSMSFPFAHLPDLEVYGVSDDPRRWKFTRDRICWRFPAAKPELPCGFLLHLQILCSRFRQWKLTQNQNQLRRPTRSLTIILSSVRLIPSSLLIFL